MQSETAALNRDVINFLDPAPGDNVLDIGTGNGMSLPQLADRVENGHVMGVDHSPVMCRRAARNNRDLIATGQVSIEQARSDERTRPRGVVETLVGGHVEPLHDDAAVVRLVTR